MTNDVSPVNIWRAWDESEGAVCLVATYDPDTGLYTRRLNAHDSKLLGEAEVVGKYYALSAFMYKHMSQGYLEAEAVFGYGTAADAQLTADDREAGFSQTVRGKRVTGESP